MIEIKDVSKIYANGTHALDHVELTIEDGEFLSIIGLSGAGKSTLCVLSTASMKSAKGKSGSTDSPSPRPKKRRSKKSAAASVLFLNNSIW